ncbi:transposase domain-containing protein [Sulfitobacter pontiacus]
MLTSFIATAKVNDVEPFAYLNVTFEAIASGHPPNRDDDLLP